LPKPRRRATPRTNGAPDLFEGRFSEVLIIFVLALIVLGPEKLPRVVTEIGRWVGRARAMARQFREQLEEEVQLEEARKAQKAEPPPVVPVPVPAQATAPEPPPPDTFSHAHPTDATGADPGAVRPAPTASADERGT
jgi:sec-independent protein translocase protein TatB